MRKKRYQQVKRVQDVILSIFGLVILSPVIVLIILLIFIDDPHGRSIYKQIRCGKNGKPFYMYKFRTMYVDADQKIKELYDSNEMDGPAFKIKDDPRITRIGSYLRRSGIDEIPQLWNVLKGDMSIVGPRPALPNEVREYKPEWKQRLLVEQGMTCYWQVTPNRNTMKYEDWMALDLKYVKERSFLTDCYIIWKTFGAVYRRDGQ